MRSMLLAAPHEVRSTLAPVPSPRAGEVLIKVGAVALCGSDLSAYRGVHPRIRLPTTPGHEFSGTVVAVGADVEGIDVGTAVAVEPNIQCGVCRDCAAGFPNTCVDYRVLGEEPSLAGACADFVVVKGYGVHEIPSSMSFEIGALVQPLSIAHHAVADRGRPGPGDWVVVVGGGPIGLAVSMFAKAQGAHTIVADRHRHRLDVATKLGADIAIDPTQDDLLNAVLDATSGRGADVAFEAAGGAQQTSLAQAMRVTKNRGRVVVLGAFSEPIAVNTNDLKYRELEVIGSQGHPASFAPTIRMLASGMPAGALISHVLPLESMAEAFRLLDSRAENVVKIVLVP